MVPCLLAAGTRPENAVAALHRSFCRSKGGRTGPLSFASPKRISIHGCTEISKYSIPVSTSAFASPLQRSRQQMDIVDPDFSLAIDDKIHFEHDYVTTCTRCSCAETPNPKTSRSTRRMVIVGSSRPREGYRAGLLTPRCRCRSYWPHIFCHDGSR